jgi:signal transduction histidine kinase
MLLVLLVLGGGLYLSVADRLRSESVDKLVRRANLVGQAFPVAGGSGPIGNPGSGIRVAAPGVSEGVSTRPGPVGTRDPAGIQALTGSTPTMGDVVFTSDLDVVRDPSQPGLLIGGPSSGTIAQVVGAASSEDTGSGPSFQATITADGRQVRDDVVNGVPMRVLIARFDIGGTPAFVQVAEDRSVELGTLQATLMVLLAGGAAAVVAAGLVGYRYSGRALVPIRDSLRRQREFAADASHELRTPLSIIRGNVQVLRRERALPDAARSAIDDIDAEADRMAALVDQLLLLARTDSDIAELSRQPVDLGQEAADALEQMTRVAEARGVVVELDVAPSPLQADPLRLRQLVAILADNAIRHAPFGGHVWVGVKAERDVARLTVDDDGPGVRPEDRVHVFDRFWRAVDAPAGGSGLGLAIAAWIVERHGGSIVVGERPGGGARFTAELPAS